MIQDDGKLNQQANRIKQKRRQLRDEVVNELHKKFLLIDAKTDVIQNRQLRGDLPQP